ncbi:MAG: MerR family transcriptional regulator [Chloroflexi bacterium]|nr:MerR family transcriptional regulator [Chloroflexota bacterium]
MTNEEELLDDAPCYVISVAARMVSMHAQTLRYYERAGLVRPSRSRGRQRLYSPLDIARLREIQGLINDLGVNLAGVDVIFRMRRRMLEMEAELEEAHRLLQRLRDRRLPAPRE